MTLDIEALRRLAGDMPLPLARIMAHDAFDALWKSGEMTRTEAYRWLAKSMDLPSSAAHMEQFDVEQCQQVARLVAERKT